MAVLKAFRMGAHRHFLGREQEYVQLHMIGICASWWKVGRGSQFTSNEQEITSFQDAEIREESWVLEEHSLCRIIPGLGLGHSSWVSAAISHFLKHILIKVKSLQQIIYLVNNFTFIILHYIISCYIFIWRDSTQYLLVRSNTCNTIYMDLCEYRLEESKDKLESTAQWEPWEWIEAHVSSHCLWPSWCEHPAEVEAFHQGVKPTPGPGVALAEEGFRFRGR